MALSNFQHSDGQIPSHFSPLKPIRGRWNIPHMPGGLRILRLALSGALAGVAIAGIISGNNDRLLYDLLGAGMGFAAVFALKFVHVV